MSFLPFPSGIAAVPISYAALPTDATQYNTGIEIKDAREERVRQFFHYYKSPLESYAHQIVADADTYGIDYTMLPAIAMQESGGCQKIIKDSYNCWGWGIHGTSVKKFTDYSNAIDTISRSLANDFKGKGLTTIELMQTKYNPENYNGWKEKVQLFISQLQSTL